MTNKTTQPRPELWANVGHGWRGAIFAVLLAMPLGFASRQWACADEPAAAPRNTCMVATVHPLATDAGVFAFESGGNAVDAAIAAAFTLGVVDGYNSGIGGGCFILIRTADGAFAGIDGRETAPAAATRDMYIRNGKADGELSQTGPLAVATPGALAAYKLANDKYGQLTMRELLTPGANLADEGFAISELYADRLKSTAETLRKFPGSRTALLKPDGSPYMAGEVLKQPDLARSYRAIAEQGTDWFYRGPFARQVGQWMRDNGGILSAEDFSNYKPLPRMPLMTVYRDKWTIIGFPPPSSGGIHVAHILNIVEPFDLRAAHREDPAEAYHLLASAMQLAFADRAHWLGDADFVDVPRGLLSKKYAAELGKQIDRNAAINPKHGLPPNADREHFGKHTTHIAAADSEGNWVAITATINTTFGSKVVVPGTGIVLNNEMDDFSIEPGVPNAFGLIGAENNAIAPGKRPLSSMSPTIVCKDAEPVMTLGAAGGPTIITQVVMNLARRLDFDQPLAAAVAAPRLHHQWRPNELVVEQAMPDELVERFEALGHTVQRKSTFGVSQAIERLPDGTWIGVADPRAGGSARQGVRQ